MAMFNASISIHALAKRATKSLEYDFIPSFISIHALAKRATNAPNGDFIIFDISIHALAKRATKAVTGMPVVFVDFNPRPRKEGDGLYQLPNAPT